MSSKCYAQWMMEKMQLKRTFTTCLAWPSSVFPFVDCILMLTPLCLTSFFQFSVFVGNIHLQNCMCKCLFIFVMLNLLLSLSVSHGNVQCHIEALQNMNFPFFPPSKSTMYSIHNRLSNALVLYVWSYRWIDIVYSIHNTLYFLCWKIWRILCKRIPRCK